MNVSKMEYKENIRLHIYGWYTSPKHIGYYLYVGITEVKDHLGILDLVIDVHEKHSVITLTLEI